MTEAAARSGSRTVRRILGEHSLRATPGRMRILEQLRVAPHPLSAAELRARIGGVRPDLATVYRTLDRFVAVGIARTVFVDPVVRRFEIAGDHHHHLTCTACRRITPLPVCAIERMEEIARTEHGFEVDDHVLELFGTCQECRTTRR
ncbi:MAG: hypothetical protein GF346_00240 [Candidatus Eisenbacteria bacterium]|nr:hypothetical protein [Candidatus Latescibacterota bacterium]MBD3300861.1 hypothetical protein [Candidatus Eisenbacteria bacterium]